MNLTTSKLNDFINFKLTNGRLNGNGGLSAKSVRDIMTVYRSIENYVAREYGIKETHFTMPKIEKKQTDILTSAERKRLENYLIHNPNKTNIAVLLCLFTGLRVGELCGLKWEDQVQIRVCKNAFRSQGKDVGGAFDQAESACFCDKTYSS